MIRKNRKIDQIMQAKAVSIYTYQYLYILLYKTDLHKFSSCKMCHIIIFKSSFLNSKLLKLFSMM